MKFYTDYIRNRLSRGKRCLSEIEKMAITSIDNYGARGEFTLLTFFDDEFYICHCKTDAGIRFRIDTMQCFKHNLKQLYAEDHISKTLANQIGALGAVGREPIFAGGSFIDKKAVVYALQQIYGRDVIQMDMKACGKLNSKSRTLFSETITKEPLHLSLPDSNIMRFIGSEGLEVFVPLQDCSLDSPFWRETTWRNMLPENYGKCMIGQSECCYLKINFEVDCFNNIFCKVTDSAQHEKYMILHAPFGAPESMEIQDLTKYNEPATVVNIPADTNIKEKEPEIFAVKCGEVVDIQGLFGDYLLGAKEIIVEDSYMCVWRHFENLKDFVNAAICTNQIEGNQYPERIHLVTKRADTIKWKDSRDPKEAFEWQEKKLREMKDNLKTAGIEFTHEFKSDFHDRLLTLSNGWYIAMGKGLDMFERPKNGIGALKCYEDTTITFSRTIKDLDNKRNKRNKRIRR